MIKPGTLVKLKQEATFFRLKEKIEVIHLSENSIVMVVCKLSEKEKKPYGSNMKSPLQFLTMPIGSYHQKGKKFLQLLIIICGIIA